MAPYQTAAMIFTATLDLVARRKATKALKGQKKKNMPSQTATMDVTVFSAKQALTFALGFMMIIVDQTVLTTVWSKPRSKNWWTQLQREWDNKDWMKHFRIGLDTFNKLCTELEHHIVKRDTCFQKPVPLQ